MLILLVNTPKIIIHKVKKLFLPKVLGYFIMSLALKNAALAQTGCPANEICSPLRAKTLIKLIENVVDIVMQIGIIVAVVAIIYAGFLYVTAQGSEDKVKKAHSIFLWTVVGVAIILGAKVIVEVVQNFFKNV